MKLICLNGWGGRLHEALIPYLVAADPDILCLQEVVQALHSPSPWLTFRDDGAALLQRADLFGEVSRALLGHVANFCPAARGDLWHNDTPVRTLWGLATYVRASIPVIAQRQGFVHGAFSPDGFGQHPRSRTAHALRLFDDRTGRATTIAHMHGLRDPDGKGDMPARRAQAEALLAMVQGVAGPGDPIVVCGDFNVLPESETFAVLGALDLIELVTARGHAGTRTSHYAKPGRFADYMLVNAAVSVERFDVVRHPEVSDHCPLVLEFS